MDVGHKTSSPDCIWPHARKAEDSEWYQSVIVVKTCHAKEITASFVTDFHTNYLPSLTAGWG